MKDKEIDITEKKWSIKNHKIQIILAIILMIVPITQCVNKEPQINQEGDGINSVGDNNTNIQNTVNPGDYFNVTLERENIDSSQYICYACRGELKSLDGKTSKALSIPPQFKIELQNGANLKDIKIYDFNGKYLQDISLSDKEQYNEKYKSFVVGEPHLESNLTKTPDFMFKTPQKIEENLADFNYCNEKKLCYLAVFQNYNSYGEKVNMADNALESFDHLRYGFNMVRIIDTADNVYDYVILHKFVSVFMEEYINISFDGKNKEESIIAEYSIFKRNDINMERISNFYGKKNEINKKSTEICKKFEIPVVMTENSEVQLPLQDVDKGLCYLLEYNPIENDIPHFLSENRNQYITKYYDRIKKILLKLDESEGA